MRILCLFFSAFIVMSSFAARAEDRKFPYEAIVDAEGGENVWSGPGAKHYPTSKLNKGEKVVVRRHDPGGWCMISPPAGSFSWIRATHVKRDGSDRGSLIANRVVVHTGSTLNLEDFTTVQADLSKGDAVEILGEKKFSGDDGGQLMLKISPIKGEWRWIPRKSIVAVDAIKSDPFPSDEPAPRRRNGPVAEGDGDSFARPVSTGPSFQEDRQESESESDGEGVRRTAQTQDQPGKQKLAAIDQQFREMIQQEPPAWNLDSLADQYKQLDEDVGTQSMSSTIVLRMDAVRRYRKIHKDYVDFFRLTSETKKRDAQLMAQQTQFQSQLETSEKRPTPINLELQPMPQQTAQLPTTVQQQMPAQTQVAPAPSFDGAGIVQKMAKSFPGGPQFVLLAPDGRMLSYLQAEPGVDLNRYAGRSVGIFGKRLHRDDWNADTIAVRSLQPVQLRGTR